MKRNIIGSRAFGSIYNRKLVIIIGKRLRRGFINSNILIFFLIIIRGFILKFFVRSSRTFVLGEFLIFPGTFNRGSNLILKNLGILRGFPSNKRKGTLVINKYFNYIDLVPKRKEPLIY